MRSRFEEAITGVWGVSPASENTWLVIAQTGSAALADGLKAQETEKADLEGQLEEARRATQRGHVCETDIFAAFRHAQRMLETKTLENTKKLVQTFIRSVVVCKDRVEIKFNLDFDPEKLKESIRIKMELAEMFGNKYKDTHQKCVSLIGGEGFDSALANALVCKGKVYSVYVDREYIAIDATQYEHASRYIAALA